jgi:hypothetical protein
MTNDFRCLSLLVLLLAGCAAAPLQLPSDARPDLAQR